MDKRASGDLRSVSLNQSQPSQQDLAAKAREHEKQGAVASASSSTALAAAAGVAGIAGGAALLGAAAELLPSASLSSPAAAAAAAAAAASASRATTTPVANEGRVRAKDMADVYVRFLPLLPFSLASPHFQSILTTQFN
jgi:hypothetical protein